MYTVDPNISIVNQVRIRVIPELSSVLDFECFKKVVFCFLLADDDIFQNAIINSQLNDKK